MTKKELIEAVAEKSGVAQGTVGKVIEDIMEVIKASVKKDNPVILRGFGMFSLEMKASKKVRDFKTGTMFTRPECKKVKFKAYNDFLG